MKPLLALLASVVLVACGATTEEVPDINLVDLQCRAPSACFTLDCACARVGFDGCKVCDPETEVNNVCDCKTTDVASVCQSPVAVCVARGPSCVGGRCVAVSGSCSTSLGEPPQTIAVGTDGGAQFETRCPFTDDQCCPGLSADLQ